MTKFLEELSCDNKRKPKHHTNCLEKEKHLVEQRNTTRMAQLCQPLSYDEKLKLALAIKDLPSIYYYFSLM